MANYGKVKLRNLDEEVLNLINSIPKSGYIKLSDLSKELRDKFTSLDLIVDKEDTIYINYNDEQLREAIQEAKESIQTELENYRRNNTQISMADLDDSVKNAIKEAKDATESTDDSITVSQEQIDSIISNFNDVRDEVQKLVNSGPTRGIVKFLYIANTPAEEELYKNAKLSPIYKPSTGKVYELTLKTTTTEYSDPDTDQEGVEYGSQVDPSNLDNKDDTTNTEGSVDEINNNETTSRHFFTGNTEPQNANIGDIWIDTSEDTSDVDTNPDTSIYDEWSVTGSEWKEIPNGLFDRNFARSLIYEPIKRKIYYCSLGKLTPIRISSDDETYDIAIPMNSYKFIDIPNAYIKNIRILIYNDDENSQEYKSYSPIKDSQCQLFIYKSQIKIKNLMNKVAYLKIVY